MKLTSQRLIFRFYEPEDFDFLYSMLNDSEMVKYIGNGKTRNTEEALAFLEWIQSHYEQNEEFGLKLLIRKEDGIPVGHAGIIPQQISGKAELEIGYWIAKEFWGNGYATEAASALLNRAVNLLGINRLISLIQPDNTRSRRVAIKNGMQLEKEIMLKGKAVSLYTYISK
ncbi:Protein N-acetyltransferase, RimJ/RimL family [Psychrobacillus sp. OK028]|uniref:GNAT family N-acetyltransferase n=1 Tax=Psychrobacillus sp. OK028 TaxID=1884359 RepID=UPI00088C6EE8|nr:GNAT family N-acetyltransferase [Psychrobacillus sp. OK028]SDN94319.1 Protein N-acetyltransferase, RimJ/RimL family [Psychrobacillus sp. OK028]